MAQKSKWITALAGGAEEPVPGQPLVEILGDSRVLVEQHGGVSAYGCQCIEIRVKFGRVRVEGERLRLARMTRSQLVVTGTIRGVQILREGCV